MAIIKIPQSVFDAGKPLPPGWYKAHIIKIEQKPAAKDPKSINTTVTFKIDEPEQYKDREVPTTFNSKFPVAAPKIQLALTGNTIDEEHPEIDTDDWKSGKLQILIGERTWQGNILNNVDDFAPYEKDLTPPDWVG